MIFCVYREHIFLLVVEASLFMVEKVNDDHSKRTDNPQASTDRSDR